MSIGARDFDREAPLRELLPAAEAERLCASLAMLLDAPVAILDLTGEPLAGTHGLGREGAAELVLELEPVGYLAAPAASKVALGAAATLARQVLVARARYRMASGVHIASVQADFEKLTAQHAALQQSEARLRALSAELESRVAAQVQLIDERQRQLYQAERLASVGRLAAGVAHEINNPLGFLRSNLSSGLRYLEQLGALGRALAVHPEAARQWREAEADFLLADFAELLRDSVAGADRVARIVSDLKGFSNVDRPAEEVADLRELLDSASNLIAPRLPRGASIERGAWMPVRLLCLPGHLSQAFLNLLTNAAQAIDDRGADGRLRLAVERLPGGARVCIEDNGTGIVAEDLPRVFDPFFTTRPVGQGSGLGLTVARDIVAAHGGRIDIDSQPGHGTRVSVSLPD